MQIVDIQGGNFETTMLISVAITMVSLGIAKMKQNAMAKKGGLKIIRVNEEIMDSLAVTGLADMLNVEKA